MTQAHSDYANTSNPAAPISGGVLVLEWVRDEEGYMVGAFTIRNPRLGEMVGDESGAERVAFDRNEIVWFEPGWPVDKDGRGLSYLEVKGHSSIRLEERRTARFIREWEQSNATHHHAVVTRFAA
jgi:hypothetical protein